MVTVDGDDDMVKVALMEPLSQFAVRLTLLEVMGSGGSPSGILGTGLKASPQE